ncbi:hypothetical protein D3C80_1127330 [compost metagenome]
MGQAEPGQQGLAHQLLKGLPQAMGRQVAEQADAGVGVLAMGARRVGWRPLAIVGAHLVGGIHLVGELQRQAPGAVGGELGHGDAVEGGAFEPGGVLAHLVIGLEAALDHGVGPKRCRKSLADRANLEQGLLAHGGSALPVCHPVVEVVGLAIFQHGHRHARDPVLLEHGPDAGIHQGAQGIALGVRSGLSQAGPQQGARRQQCHPHLLLHGHSILSVAWDRRTSDELWGQHNGPRCAGCEVA